MGHAQHRQFRPAGLDRCLQRRGHAAGQHNHREARQDGEQRGHPGGTGPSLRGRGCAVAGTRRVDHPGNRVPQQRVAALQPGIGQEAAEIGRGAATVVARHEAGGTQAGRRCLQQQQQPRFRAAIEGIHFRDLAARGLPQPCREGAQRPHPRRRSQRRHSRRQRLGFHQQGGHALSGSHGAVPWSRTRSGPPASARAFARPSGPPNWKPSWVP